MYRVDEYDGNSSPSPSRLDKLIKIRQEEENSYLIQFPAKKRHKLMVSICKGIIRDENRGATHFISSVELGAKIYRTKKVTISHATAKFLMKAGLQASNAAGLDVAFKDEHLALASNYESRIFATVDPRVKMDGTKTVVSAEHERVIGYDVRPVWVLVSDPDWQRAMKEASLQYVKEELDHSPPVIASGNYFNTLIKFLYKKIKDIVLDTSTAECLRCLCLCQDFIFVWFVFNICTDGAVYSHY